MMLATQFSASFTLKLAGAFARAAEVRLLAYGQKRGLFRRFGLELGEAAMASVEERALWARYGL